MCNFVNLSNDDFCLHFKNNSHDFNLSFKDLICYYFSSTRIFWIHSRLVQNYLISSDRWEKNQISRWNVVHFDFVLEPVNSFHDSEVSDGLSKCVWNLHLNRHGFNNECFWINLHQEIVSDFFFQNNLMSHSWYNKSCLYINVNLNYKFNYYSKKILFIIY